MIAGNFKNIVIADPKSTAVCINCRTEKGWIPFLLLIRKLKINVACRVALLTCILCRIPATRVSAAEDDSVPDGITVLNNLHYREGTEKNWNLDLAMPNDSMGKLRPAIIVIHGGGWESLQNKL